MIRRRTKPRNQLAGILGGSIGLPPLSEITFEHSNPGLQELLAGLGRQCFYDGDILQQLLRQTVPLS
jgi:hypothetical protein